MAIKHDQRPSPTPVNSAANRSGTNGPRGGQPGWGTASALDSWRAPELAAMACLAMGRSISKTARSSRLGAQQLRQLMTDPRFCTGVYLLIARSEAISDLVAVRLFGEAMARHYSRVLGVVVTGSWTEERARCRSAYATNRVIVGTGKTRASTEAGTPRVPACCWGPRTPRVTGALYDLSDPALDTEMT